MKEILTHQPNWGQCVPPKNSKFWMAKVPDSEGEMGTFGPGSQMGCFYKDEYSYIFGL